MKKQMHGAKQRAQEKVCETRQSHGKLQLDVNPPNQLNMTNYSLSSKNTHLITSSKAAGLISELKMISPAPCTFT